MRKMFLMLTLASGLMAVSVSAQADLNSFLRSVHNQALSDITEFNNKLSQQFGIPVPNVEAIVSSLPDPADAFMILQLGQMAHVAPEVVLQRYQRSKGKGWGDLAHELGIKPGSPEFHALKRGDLSFTGERHDGAKHGNKKKSQGEDGSGKKQEKGKGKGRGKD